MYSKDRATSITKNDNKFIPAGIIEDVVLKSAKIETSPTGKEFFEITFEKNEAKLLHTEWEPTKNQYVDTDEKLQIKMDNQYSRMLQILACFYKLEDINFDGESFKDFAKYIVDKLNEADKSIKLRVKVVYNKDGYTTLPSYARFTFIEPMELPEGETSKIVKLDIDQFTKPVVADKETKNDNPFANTANTSSTLTGSENNYTTTSTRDDLPF